MCPLLRALGLGEQIVARRLGLLQARFVALWLAMFQRIAFLLLERVFNLRSVRPEVRSLGSQRLGEREASNAHKRCYGTHFPYSVS